MKVAKPEEFGFATERLARVRTGMQGYVDGQKIAGFVSLVARRGQVVHLEHGGWMDIAAGKPMAHDSIFRIYSMSKPITSAALMMLFEENCFRLNDPVSAYIPSFKKMKVIGSQKWNSVDLVDAQREITIRDLFTQQPVDTDIWYALAWCVGILILAYTLAMITYRRRIS